MSLFGRSAGRYQFGAAAVFLLTISAVCWAQSATAGGSGGVAAAAASERTYGLILYAQGRDISIYRNGLLATYDLSRTDVVGEPLFENDLVQTDAGTYLEIQLLPSQSVIKVAENTTFKLDSISSTGAANLDLTYGRIRAKVQKIVGAATDNSYPFTIRGSTVLAGVRGTDFGYDIVAERKIGNLPVSQVYCFEGSVEVTATAAQPGSSSTNGASGAGSATGAGVAGTPAGGSSGPQSVVLRANEMVSVASVPASSSFGAGGTSAGASSQQPSSSATTVVLQTDSVSSDISSYWKKNDFATTPIDPAAATTKFPGLERELDRHFEEPAPSTLASTSGTAPSIDESDTETTATQAASSAPTGDTTGPSVAGSGTAAGGDQDTAGGSSPASGEQTAETSVPQAAEQSSADAAAHEEQLRVQAGLFHNVGIGMATGGVVVAAAGGAMFLFGSDVFPSMTSATQTTISRTLGISGGILLVSGIAAYLFSVAIHH